MFHRLVQLMQMRHSTAFLLTRADDRLLEDVGLTRADLQALHLGLGGARPHRDGQETSKLSPCRALPVAG